MYDVMKVKDVNIDKSQYDKIIIQFQTPSFGDYLMFSDLMWLFYEKYGLYTYLYHKCTFYDQDSYRLLFLQNPYFKDISSELPNTFPEHVFKYLKTYLWFPDLYEERYGGIRKNIIPKIYYIPKVEQRTTKKVLVDLSARSYKNMVINHKDSIINTIQSIINDKYNGYEVLNVSFNSPDTSITRLCFPNSLDIKVSNLFNLCDIYNNVDVFFGINSGGALLASCIKEHYNHNIDIYTFNYNDKADGQNWNPYNANILYI